MMETPTLSAYLMPSIYHEEAITAASVGPIEELSVDLLVIRLVLELYNDNVPAAQGVFAILEKQILVGWLLYQKATCGVFLAIKVGIEKDIVAALDVWLTGMAQYPGNWTTGILQAPEVIPWLAGFDAKRLAPPEPKRKKRMTRAERAFVKAPNDALAKAVLENLQWFQELGVEQSPDKIASWYKLGSVDLDLNEAYFETRKNLPTLVVACDGQGQFQGSFFLH